MVPPLSDIPYFLSCMFPHLEKHILEMKSTSKSILLLNFFDYINQSPWLLSQSIFSKMLVSSNKQKINEQTPPNRNKHEETE